MSAFILQITTTTASETVIIPGAGVGYSYDIDWDDGTVETSQTNNSPSHVYVTAGVYEVAISGTFPRVYYNNGTYKLQPTAIIQWGDENTWSDDQANAFYGCANLAGLIPSDNLTLFDVLTNGYRMFRSTNISGSLPAGMNLPSLTSGYAMFYDTDISGSLPAGMNLPSLTNGNQMFSSTNISGSLPAGMNLPLLADGASMFSNSNISGSLPAGMELPLLTNGASMFSNSDISGSLPAGMNLPSLVSGASMFYNNSISGSLPAGMSLPLLVSGTSMFRNAGISGSLPAGMNLPSLVSGAGMFRETAISGNLPSGMELPLLTDGANMFTSTNIDTSSYSDFLVRMEAANSNDDVDFHGGNATYNYEAVAARASLVSRGWTITDGGRRVRTISLSQTGDYTFSLKGDASVSVTAGTATGTGFGSATEASPLTFNITSTGTVIFTLDSGNFDSLNSDALAQLEIGSVATSIIPATAGGESRTATTAEYTVPASNSTTFVVTGLDASLDPDPADTTERTIVETDWSGTISDVFTGPVRIKSIEVEDLT